MKTKNTKTVRQLVLAALFLALAFVLPLLTGQVPKVGNMLCPMHFPVLLCGFVLGGPWGLAVGFAAPLLRSVLFGMPPMFPVAISMAFELATYGLVSGLLWRRAKHSLPALYAVLLTAMVSGRIVWGIVRFVLAGLTGGSFPFSAFLSGALFTAVPGIAAQLVLIPLLLTALQKAGHAYHVALGDAAVKVTVRVCLLEHPGLGSGGQIGVQHHQIIVAFRCQLLQGVAVAVAGRDLFHVCHLSSPPVPARHRRRSARSWPPDTLHRWGPCRAMQRNWSYRKRRCP